MRGHLETQAMAATLLGPLTIAIALYGADIPSFDKSWTSEFFFVIASVDFILITDSYRLEHSNASIELVFCGFADHHSRALHQHDGTNSMSLKLDAAKCVSRKWHISGCCFA